MICISLSIRGMFGLLGVLLITGTGVDLLERKHVIKWTSRSWLSVKCFSLYTNTAELLSVDRGPGMISCLDGIRLLARLEVIAFHLVAYINVAPVANPTILREAASGMESQILLNGLIHVHTFFVIR